ncbi:MAG: hypothetical protein PF541_14755 [Prolixibacteraceae bacterium]|nr:hypothetical protein [Prolixibacteraceae bacterium]
MDQILQLIKKLILTSLVLITCFFDSYSQSLNTQITISTGYSFNMPKGDVQILLRPTLDHSPIIAFGGLCEYKPLNKLSVASGLLISNEWFSYSVVDWDAMGRSMGENVDPVEQYELMNTNIYVEKSLPSLEVPLTVQYYLKKHFYILGGLSFKYQLKNTVKKRIETYSSFGIGSNYTHWGWKLNFQGTINDRVLKTGFVASHPSMPDLDLAFSSRSINFSLNYNLWSKQ